MRSKLIMALAAAAALAAWLPPAARPDTLQVVGYGQHTEGPTKTLMIGGVPRTVGPFTASFAVTNDSAMCAVGEAGGEVAPFNMLVYATEITRKVWSGRDPVTGNFNTLTLEGTARSITTVGGVILEDVLTPFSATAHDSGQPLAGDYFHITINTTLWPHQTFGRDLDGNPIQPFAGDVAIGRPIATG